MSAATREGESGMLRAEAVARSSAAPAKLFALLQDGASWPEWTLFDRFELERPGHAEPLGVGAIRIFSTKVSRAREEIVELVPERRLSYVLLSGFPLRDYRADVELEPTEDGGTIIRWRSRFFAKYPGTGWFWQLFIQRVLERISRDLAVAAGR
jgi:hypothetical protein